MPAIVRGGPRAAVARSQPKPASRSRSRAGARAPTYAPAKIRAGQRIGLKPCWALAVSAGLVALGLIAALVTGDRFQRLMAKTEHGAAVRLAGVGFRVDDVHVEGATREAAADILRASGLQRNEPILGVDLKALRGRIEQVGWVKSARVVRLLPDAVVISVVQRDAAAVWQHDGRSLVVDGQGRPIPEANSAEFAELPLVVGEGANLTAPLILPMIRARPRLMQRLEALVRVDDRRWDLRLKDGGLIQLPATGEESALIQLDGLDQKARILDLGFSRIDLRDPDMVAVRPKDPGAPGGAPQQVSGA
ncbi:MAG TPA: cell division protein FtsQ/DivIB [Caulobacteraceae bacterium]